VSNIDVNLNQVRQNRWKKVTKKTVVSLCFVLAYLFVGVGSLVLAQSVFSGSPAPALAIALVTSNAVMFVLFFHHRRETRDRWINDEAQNFLASRSLQSGTPLSTWRKKIRFGMTWAPTVFVLVVFLFFPEFLGLISHLSGRPSLDHFRLEIPLTWIIADVSSSYIDSRLVGSETWIVAAKGIGRVGLAAYWRMEEPISEMTFSAAPYNPNDVWFPARAKVLSTREVSFGNGTLTCWDIIPYPGMRPTDPAFAEIICPPGKNGFGAHFSGWRTDTIMFYKTLQRVAREQ
jgi:hypothetical protein